MVDALGVTAYSYDAAGQLLSEDGPWPDDAVSYAYNNRLRMSLELSAPNSTPWMQSYAYDSARRLTNVLSPAGAFSYAYDPQRSTLPATMGGVTGGMGEPELQGLTAGKNSLHAVEEQVMTKLGNGTIKNLARLTPKTDAKIAAAQTMKGAAEGAEEGAQKQLLKAVSPSGPARQEGAGGCD